MRNKIVPAISASFLVASAASASTGTLNFVTARPSTSNGGSISLGSVNGRANTATLNASAGEGAAASIWGTATGGYGMPGSGNAGVGGWAGGNGGLLSDITGINFDWYRASGGLAGGFRVAMYVYSPVAQGDISGFLQFDLMAQLPGQTGGQWEGSGNVLAGPTGAAWYRADYGGSQYAGYKTWADIQTALAGWSVYEIGIINDAGYSVAIDKLLVSYVPAPGAIALLGIAGIGASRRRR
ncbi:MAG: PEP-CTERM sorting domain-containing protein [Planctomycetota bacterium]